MEDTMKKIKNQKCLMGAIALILFVFNINLYSLICSNGSGRGYEGVGNSVTGSSIESYIVDGAGFYLNAKLDIETILRLIELKDIQGLDYKILNMVVDSAISDIKTAIGTYDVLIQEASNTPYDEEIQKKLITFDYSSFMLLNGLNKTTFSAVSGFLKYGDITGSFKKTHLDMKNILAMLQTIKGATALNRLPDLSIIWRLNESCCEVSLFGSYVARVFSAIQ
jgi:hypothetical protein